MDGCILDEPKLNLSSPWMVMLLFIGFCLDGWMHFGWIDVHRMDSSFLHRSFHSHGNHQVGLRSIHCLMNITKENSPQLPPCSFGNGITYALHVLHPRIEVPNSLAMTYTCLTSQKWVHQCQHHNEFTIGNCLSDQFLLCLPLLWWRWALRFCTTASKLQFSLLARFIGNWKRVRPGACM